AQVTLWARREEVAREIREEHRNRTYLGGHRLPAEVTATSSVAEAVDGADGIVVALPAQSLRPTLTGWRQLPGLSQGLPSVPVLSLVKGIERGTDSRISEVLGAPGGNWSGCCRDRTCRPRSCSAGPAEVSSPRPHRIWPTFWRAGATRPICAPTPPPTWWAWRSPERSRTSSPSRSGRPPDWGTGTTPPRA